MMSPRFFALLIVVCAASVLLVALNPQVIDVHLLAWHWRVRVGALMAVMVALGLIVGVALRASWLGALLRERGRLRRALKAAEERVLSAQRSAENPSNTPPEHHGA